MQRLFHVVGCSWQRSSSKYCNAYTMAQQLRITPHHLSRITGTVFVVKGTRDGGGAPRVNVGLNLKFNRTSKEVRNSVNSVFNHRCHSTDSNWSLLADNHQIWRRICWKATLEATRCTKLCAAVCLSSENIQLRWRFLEVHCTNCRRSCMSAHNFQVSSRLSTTENLGFNWLCLFSANHHACLLHCHLAQLQSAGYLHISVCLSVSIRGIFLLHSSY